ncbi:hypothetical protein RhiirA4_476650 [Rhizophagus irregularis]|uniref:Uncharacterized protein n=1 Tax=Rhizophagus irregularis TaxID=588596 RepID=A0A2I1HC20_9GLOM|nr:hypothetical protein RhiirA4_476650 [Rhizophagus irregularis]
MTEILVSYRSLVVDSLEAMRDEYVSIILHTAGDATNKEFSMKPEYEIIETNKRKRKRDDDDDDFDYLYGIRTTARDRHFLLYSPGFIDHVINELLRQQFEVKNAKLETEKAEIEA